MGNRSNWVTYRTANVLYPNEIEAGVSTSRRVRFRSIASLHSIIWHGEVYSFDLDKVVPPDHLVRQIDGLLDLGWVHKELAPLICQAVKGSLLDAYSQRLRPMRCQS